MIAPADGADLYYEITGSGEPVLLIMGLGMAATGWWRTVEVLAEQFRVIAFDNRGAGRSDAHRTGRTPSPCSPPTRPPCSTPPARSRPTSTGSRWAA